jgi:hypothetical protein
MRCHSISIEQVGKNLSKIGIEGGHEVKKTIIEHPTSNRERTTVFHWVLNVERSMLDVQFPSSDFRLLTSEF